METESTRQQKVGRQIQKDLGEMFQQQGMAAYNGALITVTRVRVSPDLSLAKVYLSIFPSDKANGVMALVKENSRTLRGELGKRVRNQLRIVPELAFFIDNSLDYVERIENLLK